ncbi:hypothetical protein DID88_000866 [Monilinia fructigena]|uniref:Uncharacterized protein n=1 Tax=Monilinia fructigena TaxID=38457 RepID=A0A395IZQ9_9HELO|nr:hypothetical protein DID88_000866 [Monilinia fructigena]
MHDEESDTSDDSIENGHSAKVRRRGRLQASTRNPTLRSVVRTAGFSRRFPNHEMRNRLPSQTQNEVEREALMTLYAAGNHDSKAESILAPSELSAAEAPSAKKDESGIERPVVVVRTFDEWKALLDAAWVENYRIIHQYDGVLPPRTPIHRGSSPDFNQPSLSNAELEREHRLFHQYDGIFTPRTPSPQSSSQDSDRPNSPQMPDREVFSCFEVLGGNLCKHIVFVLVKVLMLEAPLRHQVAFLSSEVESIARCHNHR